MHSRKIVWNEDESELLQQKFGFKESAAFDILWLHSELIGVKESTIVIEYPEANQIQFESLPSLKKFCCGDIVEWPSLKKVIVNHCPNIRKFGLGKTKSVILENQESLANIFESWDDFYSTIVEYEIDDSEELRKRMHNLRPSHFTNIVVFRAKNCDRILVDFISILMNRSKKLEVIEIQHCNLSHYYLFDFSNPTFLDEKVKYLTQIKELKLIQVYEVKALFYQDFQWHMEFKNLQIIHLETCPSILFLFTTSHEMKNLRKLFVSNCGALKTVIIGKEIPNSIDYFPQLDELILINLPNLTHIIHKEYARLCQNLHMMQVRLCKSLNWLPISITLTKMKIVDCDVLCKTIIVKNEEERGKTIFSQLKDVTLQNLRDLCVAFPSTSEFPSLETLRITNCPSLITFVEEPNELKEHQEQVTSTYFFPNSLSLEKLKVLYIIDQDVNEIWHSSSPSESFFQLENLTLSNSNKLSSVISSHMITRFNNMKELHLDKCESLITIFNLEYDKPDHPTEEMFPQLMTIALSNLNNLKFVWNKEPHVPFFSNLVSLFIVRCGSIESIFSLSSSKYLEKLKLLRLCSCKELMEVILSDENKNVSTIFP
ncbi:uncharacterized protein LOC114189162 [Vigna unguiculata]|uniref:uncharacterized protein LOC114189162 n=1 Tax=Vigna unguiculata TaxID=3917 RepID=UPI001016B42D|nr:uncharacterized protein LOC114189162 [Vigna unguiculata]